MHTLSVAELSKSLKNKEFSSVELTQHYLDRLIVQISMHLFLLLMSLHYLRHEQLTLSWQMAVVVF